MATVKCKRCGLIEYIAFGDGLSKGWPTCCQQTMELQPVDQSEIAQGVAEVMHPVAIMRKFLKGS